MSSRRPRPFTLRPARKAAPAPAPDALTTIDLDEDGWLVSAATGRPVRPDRLARYLADRLNPPSWATDVIVYVHGWRTSPASAARSAQRLLTLMDRQRAARTALYPRLSGRYAPWTVVVRWPSSSKLTKGGYEEVRERAHAMSAAGTGYAPTCSATCWATCTPSGAIRPTGPCATATASTCTWWAIPSAGGSCARR